MDEDDGSLGGGNGISLREAVKYSAAGDTITFDPVLSGQTIRLTLGELLIAQSISIDSSALPQPITLSADRTGNGKTADDTYVIQLNAGALVLDTLILADANLRESQGCITTAKTGSFSLTLNHCTLTRNSGYHAGAIYWTLGSLTILNSTFSDNSAVKGGSSLDVGMAAVSIENATFSDNTGITIDSSDGSLSLRNTTIAGNVSIASGSALHNHGTVVASIVNSIVTGNNSPSKPNITGLFTGTNNLTSGDPRLAPLGDYGGPTQTMPPLTTSPTIDAGGATTLTTDQRGLPRDGKPDIGAVEYQGTRNLAAPSLDLAGDATLSFGTPPSTSGFAWVLSRSPDLSPGSYREIYRYQGGADIAASGTTFVRTAAFITITDANAPAESGYYRIGLVPVP